MVMQYNKKKTNVLYPNTISNKIKFDEDEPLNIILLILIKDFKDQFPYTENITNCWLEDYEGFALNPNTFTHVKDLQKKNYKVSLIFQNEDNNEISTNAILISDNPKSNTHFEIIDVEDYDDHEKLFSFKMLFITNLISLTLFLVQKTNTEVYQLRIFDVINKTWVDKAAIEFILPETPFAKGAMRQAYLVEVFNMIDDLKLESTQMKFVVKSYKSLYKN
ncbi:hypothetical protein RCL_jg18961.t1 [Rhizophagus clarus]|uniref:Uncharacterized protein n=2 Tax=Rhizophagus clarus TaxID=94130 RepID=A0A8H3R611_9GLOM|nr:hypothetical protein RCL_jg18961.t1 [Rhizophagus clarus]